MAINFSFGKYNASHISFKFFASQELQYHMLMQVIYGSTYACESFIMGIPAEDM